VIGRDRRTYRFVKDTRIGRVVIGETTDLTRIADLVTDYLAERLVEHERALETDRLLARVRDAATPRQRVVRDAVRASSDADTDNGGATVVWLVVALLIGIAIGAIGLISYAWFAVPGAG
jgi:hypothetical protein